MSKTRNTGFLTNVINVDTYGNVNIVSGSTTLLSVSSSGAVTTTGVISGSNALSASYSISGSYTVSSSYAFTASSAINSFTASNANTASSADTFIVRNNLTGSNALFTGAITAQTLIVSTISASVEYSSGSNIFGGSTANRQTFTGSMYITGSNLTANIDNACFSGQICANSIGLPAGGTINNLANIQYSGYTWASYTTSDGTITFSNSSGCPIKFATGEACFANAINSPGGTISQDLRVYRSAGTTTGYINFGSTGTNYFGFDGSKYVVNGCISATGGLFSGNVGIGPGSVTDCYYNSQLVVGSDTTTNNGFTMSTTATGASAIWFARCSTGVGRYRGSFAYNQQCDTFYWRLGGDVLKMQLDTNAACFAGAICAPLLYASSCAGIGTAASSYTLSVGGRGYFFATNQDAGWGNLTLDYGNGDNGNIYAIQMKEGGAVNAAIGYGSYGASSCGDVIMWANNGGGLVERMRIYANSGTKFYVEESSSNTNGFGVVGRTCSKAVYIGANCTYGSIQSHGSVPLRINELGNDIILAAASNNVGVGTTTPSAKLEVAGVICASGAICSNGTIWVGTNLRVGSGTSVGNSTDPAITAGGCSKAGIYFDNGSVGMGACGQAAYMNANGTLQTTSTTMFGSNGLWQQSVGGIRFNAQSLGGGVVHIKTNIYHQNSVMIAANVRGYEYSPDAIDTDIYFYTYTGASYVYGFGVYKKTATGWTYGAYYSTDDYVVLYVSGLGNYAGFTLNFNNTSLLQNSEVKVLAWKAASTTSAQY